MNKLLHRQREAKKQGFDYNPPVTINYAIVPRGVVMQFSATVNSLTMTPAEAEAMVKAIQLGIDEHAKKMAEKVDSNG